MSKLFDEIMQSYNDIVSMKNETTQDKVDRMLFINDMKLALGKIKEESEHCLDEIFKKHVYKYLKDIGFEGEFIEFYDFPDYNDPCPYDIFEQGTDEFYYLDHTGKYQHEIWKYNDFEDKVTLLELTFCPVTLEIEVHHNEFEG